MRSFIILFGSAAALGALPASAQLAGTLGGAVNTGVNATVNTAQTTDAVLNTASKVTTRSIPQPLAWSTVRSAWPTGPWPMPT